MNLTMKDLSPSTRLARLAAVAALLAGAATGALAQYKIVGPDGSVTYTDKPPAAANARIGNQGVTGGGTGGVPYDVQKAMSRYPVTLFAAKGCAPCDQARSFLKGHNIPFSEYSVETNSDIEALKGRFGEAQLPVVTIGGQTMKGFNGADLQGYLDAAGYPKQARLSGYAWPAATPLAPMKAVPAPAQVAQPAPTPSPEPVAQPASHNGIQF
jgi:glutaredoxin